MEMKISWQIVLAIIGKVAVTVEGEETDCIVYRSLFCTLRGKLQVEMFVHLSRLWVALAFTRFEREGERERTRVK